MDDLDKMALLPCPFCGNPDVQLVTFPGADGDALHAVGCPKCGCNGTPHVAAMDDPLPAAVAAWNRRALLTAPPGWKLVPVELKEELALRIAKAMQGSEQFGWTWEDCSPIEVEGWMNLANAAISAMLAAAQALAQGDNQFFTAQERHDKYTAEAERLMALIDGQARDNGVRVDRGALQMAINALRRAGKHEVADALAGGVIDGQSVSEKPQKRRCPNNAAPGGCQLPNRFCTFPDCEKADKLLPTKGEEE